MTPPPGYQHENAVSRLIRMLSEYMIPTDDKGTLHVPRAGIMRKPNSWLEPDLFYVSAETEARLVPDKRSTADLVVEVISPGSAIYDRNTKADTYAALGVKELWLIDESAHTVEVRLLKDNAYERTDLLEGDDVAASTVLEKFAFKVGELFGD